MKLWRTVQDATNKDTQAKLLATLISHLSYTYTASADDDAMPHGGLRPAADRTKASGESDFHLVHPIYLFYTRVLTTLSLILVCSALSISNSYYFLFTLLHPANTPSNAGTEADH